MKVREHECIAKISSKEFETTLDTLENFGSRVTIASQERTVITFTTMGTDGMGHIALNPVPLSSFSGDASHCFDSKYVLFIIAC